MYCFILSDVTVCKARTAGDLGPCQIVRACGFAMIYSPPSHPPQHGSLEGDHNAAGEVP